jgi:hypothetical protein
MGTRGGRDSSLVVPPLNVDSGGGESAISGL